MIGDYHLGDITYGFDYYRTIVHNSDTEGATYYEPVFNINGKINDHPENTHSTDAITSYTIEHI